jgi:hypothetical protein
LERLLQPVQVRRLPWVIQIEGCGALWIRFRCIEDTA